MNELADDFYEQIKPRLYERIGKELRLARRVLDVGCGSCELVKYLAQTYCQEVTGVDISSGGFPPSQDSGDGARFRCIKKDGASLDFIQDANVDTVVTMWALHEMEHHREILAEAHRVLRVGGEMLVVDFPRDSLAQKLWNENYYSLEDVKRLLLKAGFCEIRGELIEQDQIMWIVGHRASLQFVEK